MWNGVREQLCLFSITPSYVWPDIFNSHWQRELDFLGTFSRTRSQTSWIHWDGWWSGKNTPTPSNFQVQKIFHTMTILWLRFGCMFVRPFLRVSLSVYPSLYDFVWRFSACLWLCDFTHFWLCTILVTDELSGDNWDWWSMFPFDTPRDNLAFLKMLNLH